MKLNFYPFHKHSYKVIKWRLVHLQNSFAPSSRVLLLKCTGCGKEKNEYPRVERDTVWEEENRHLEGYWNSKTLAKKGMNIWRGTISLTEPLFATRMVASN